MEADAPAPQCRTPPESGNIVLIGMPGAGKSTLGVLLAKATARDFVDTDVVLQARAGCHLQQLLEEHGPAGFRAIEAEAVLSLTCRNSAVATGGSVVYGTRAMRHLRQHGRIVHLDAGTDVLGKRLANLPTRGVVRDPGQSLQALFDERYPLYTRWADVTVACGDAANELSHEQVVTRILQALGGATD